MEWINVKDRFPAIGEFVEVIYPDKNHLEALNRDFCAYWKDDTGCFWTRSGLDERDWSSKGFQIKYCRPMLADVKGRKPFLKTNRSGYFRVYMKKVS